MDYNEDSSKLTYVISKSEKESAFSVKDCYVKNSEEKAVYMKEYFKAKKCSENNNMYVNSKLVIAGPWSDHEQFVNLYEMEASSENRDAKRINFDKYYNKAFELSRGFEKRQKMWFWRRNISRWYQTLRRVA